MRHGLLPALALLAIAGPVAAQPKDDYVPLFNGKDLTGWTPKITGHDLGVNFGDTFRVEGGVLKVSYDKYDEFKGQFGHLFYKERFSRYALRVEYRFVGEQCKGGPGWAVRNSGAMLHCQDPKTMRKDQEFPVSIEAQFLGGLGKGDRPTGNVCTPGTNIVIGKELITRHCTNSKSKTIPGDVWVTAVMEVHGGNFVRHHIDGEVVMEYEQPQLDPKDADGAKLIQARGGRLLLDEGYISLQAESHPVEFRKVEIKVLKN
jgi:hypothetical protein